MLTKDEENVINSFVELFEQQAIITETMKSVAEAAKDKELDVQTLKKIAKARADDKVNELKEKTQSLLDKLES